MDKLKPKQSHTNVNVTLASSGTVLPEILGKEFPCPLCGAGLPILISKRSKPYFTCNSCGVQIFIRGKAGISRLSKLAKGGILISAREISASYGIMLLNRLEQLNLQRKDLILKRPLIFKDINVENAIQLVDGEIENVQGELAEIASLRRKELDK
jgi:predicted RNA-binding Zn-ribbon protein involved in translation (DUF1610 family)